MSSLSVAIELDLVLSGSHHTLALFLPLFQNCSYGHGGVSGGQPWPFTWMSTKRTKHFTDPLTNSDFSLEF
jgi:hypothetical protein